MSAAAGVPAIFTASVGADGRLLSADEPIALLQNGAGGTVGGPLLVPQLAALARLVTQLKVPIARPVTAASDLTDIDMWVRAQPRGETVQLTVADWRERSARPSSVLGDVAGQDVLGMEGRWHWLVDTQMRFVSVDQPERESEGDAVALPQPGSRLTAWFRLLVDADGAMPILQAITERRAFDDQRAVAIAQPGEELILSGRPVFDVAGRLTGYRGVVIAPEVEASEAPTTVANEEPDAEALSTLFSRRLDKALKQPLTRIIARADTIAGALEGPLREDYSAYAGDIANAGRHLMDLVDDLADLQAIDRPDFQVIREEVDVADIARRAAGLLGMRAADKSIRVDAPRTDEAVGATGEFRRALQVMVNLIGNAIRYSPEGSMVWIRVEREGDLARVVVADQGHGIAPEDQERIFGKFERLGRSEAGGSGLGLYISRRLARAMGGDIEVESNLGAGARFSFVLPAAR